MKIRFISYKLELRKFSDNVRPILGPKEKMQFGEFVHSYVLLSNITDIKKYKKKGYLYPSESAEHILKALEYNKEFSQFIIRKRLEGHIRKPRAEKDLRKELKTWNKNSPNEISAQLLKDPLIAETLKDYSVHSELIEQIPLLVRFGCVFLPSFLPEITIATEYTGSGPQTDLKRNTYGEITQYKEFNQINLQNIDIKVSANISINQIKKFLDANKAQIERQLTPLKNNTFKISGKEYKIFNLRNSTTPMPHRKIATMFKKPNGAFETDENVKRIYCTTRKKISSLFTSKQ